MIENRHARLRGLFLLFAEDAAEIHPAGLFAVGLGLADPPLAVDGAKTAHGFRRPEPQSAIAAPGSLLRRRSLEDHVLILRREPGGPVDGVAAVGPGSRGDKVRSSANTTAALEYSSRSLTVAVVSRV